MPRRGSLQSSSRSPSWNKGKLLLRGAQQEEGEKRETKARVEKGREKRGERGRGETGGDPRVSLNCSYV